MFVGGLFLHWLHFNYASSVAVSIVLSVIGEKTGVHPSIRSPSRPHALVPTHAHTHTLAHLFMWLEMKNIANPSVNILDVRARTWFSHYKAFRFSYESRSNGFYIFWVANKFRTKISVYYYTSVTGSIRKRSREEQVNTFALSKKKYDSEESCFFHHIRRLCV